MRQTEEILQQLREKQKVLIVSEDQKQLERLFDELCQAGFCNVTMPLFEADYAKRELARELGQCLLELHKAISPFGKSILDVKQIYDACEGEAIECELPYVGQLTAEDIEELASVVEEYVSTRQTQPEDKCAESWDGIAIEECTEELMNQIEETFPKLLRVLDDIKSIQLDMENMVDETYLPFDWKHIDNFLAVFEKILRLQKAPADWMYQADLPVLLEKTQQYQKQCMEYRAIREELCKKYRLEVFDLDAVSIRNVLEDGLKNLNDTMRMQGQNDGFILDNLRHFASRTDLLYGNLYLLKQDLDLIRDHAGMKHAATFQTVPMYYEMVELLEHKEKGRAWLRQSETLETARNIIEKNKSLHKTSQKKESETDKEKVAQCLERLKKSLESAAENRPEEWIMPTISNYHEVEQNLAVCTAILGAIRPCKSWLTREDREYLLAEIEECESQCMRIQKLSYELLEEHNDTIFQIPCEEMRQRFQESYQSVLGRMKSSYKMDRERIINTFLIPQKTISDEEILHLLNTLCILRQMREWFRGKKPFLIEHIGTYYHGEHTNWGLLKEDIKEFEELEQYFPTIEDAYHAIIDVNQSLEDVQKYYASLVTLRNVTREALSCRYQSGNVSNIGLEEIVDTMNQMLQTVKGEEADAGKEEEQFLSNLFGDSYAGKHTNWRMLEQILSDMEKKQEAVSLELDRDVFLKYLNDESACITASQLSIADYKTKVKKIQSDLQSFLKTDDIGQCEVDATLQSITQVKDMCIRMDDCIADVKMLANRPMHATQVLEDIKRLARIQEIEEEFSEENQEKQNDYGSLYQGVATDWNYICEQINLAKSMRSDVGKYHFSRTCMEAMLNAEQSGIDSYHYMEQLSGATLYRKEFAFVNGLFSEDTDLGEMQIERLYQKLSGCYMQKDRLSEWILYEKGKQKCKKRGLSSFVNVAKENHLETKDMKNAFYKTFYKKWMEYQMAQGGGLKRYVVRTMEEIEEMKRLNEDKTDIRTMEAVDYIMYVPNWLSRLKNCLLVSNDNVETSFYQKVVLEPEVDTLN